MVELHSSYFYHIRYFKPYMIPLSTAVYDPKWYHNNRDQGYRFLDKNGVINGLKITPLIPGSTCEDLCRGSLMCNIEEGPTVCAFMRNYKEQLKR